MNTTDSGGSKDTSDISDVVVMQYLKQKGYLKALEALQSETKVIVLQVDMYSHSCF